VSEACGFNSEKSAFVKLKSCFSNLKIFRARFYKSISFSFRHKRSRYR